MAPVALFIFSLLAHLVVLHSTEEEQIYKRCPPFRCNDHLSELHFPFKTETQPSECGLFTVDCSDQQNPRIQLKEKGYWHKLQSISSTNTISINDTELQRRLKSDSCNDQFFNDLSLPSPSPVFELFAENLTLVKCNNTTPTLPLITDSNYICTNATNATTYYTRSDDSLRSPPLPPLCSTIQPPPSLPSFQPPLSLPSLATEFKLQPHVSEACYRCYDIKGECGVDDKGKFKCSVGEKGDKLHKLGLKLGLGKIDISEVKYLIHMDDHLGQLL